MHFPSVAPSLLAGLLAGQQPTPLAGVETSALREVTQRISSDRARDVAWGAIPALDDDSFTRSVGYFRDFVFSHTVLRVRDVAAAVLARITGQPLGSRARATPARRAPRGPARRR